MVALHSGFLDGPIHALNRPAARLTVGPGMRELGKAVSDTVLQANTVKNVPTSLGLMRHITKQRTVVRQYFMNFIR